MQQDNSRYVISRSKEGEFYFVLTSQSGDVLVTSENFTSRELAETGIRHVRGSATVAKVVDAAE